MSSTRLSIAAHREFPGQLLDGAIPNGESGLLVADPTDLAAFGAAVETLLRDRELAETIGRNAQQRATALFLGDRHLEQYGRLFARLE